MAPLDRLVRLGEMVEMVEMVGMPRAMPLMRTMTCRGAVEGGLVFAVSLLVAYMLQALAPLEALWRRRHL